MENLNRDSIDFANGNITRIFTGMLFPTLMGMMFTMLFCITDGIFIGHGVGSDGLAAVNIIMPVFTLATGIGMMFAIGSSVVAAIHLSHDNLKAARIVVTQAFVAAIILGFLIGLMFYLFPDRIIALLGSGEKLMDICRDYYLWFIPCSLFVMLQILGQFIIRLDGSPTYSMLVEVVPACLNIFLDWLLIFPLDMGLKGAALATSIGSFAGVIMVFWYMLFEHKTLSFYKLRLTLTSFVLAFRNVWYMVKVGVSGFIGEFSMSVLTLVGNYMFMRYLGEDGVAAFSVICYILPIIFMIYAAISQSAQPIISYNYGAGNNERVRKVVRLAFVAALASGAIMSVLLVFFTRPIVAVFMNQSSDAYQLCIGGLPFYVAGLLFMAFSLTFIGFCQSLEKILVSSVLTILRGMLLPACFFVLLPRFIGATGLWIAVPISEFITSLLIILFFRRMLIIGR